MLNLQTVSGPLDPAKGLGPKGLLIFGIFSLGLALGGILTGVSLVRFGRVIYRSEEPKQFWESIVLYFLGGVLLLGAYLFNIPGQGVAVILLMGSVIYIVYLLISWAIRKMK
jgi:hypothetical protein